MEFTALLDGIDWRRVQATRAIPRRARLRRIHGTMRAGADDAPTLPEDPSALRALLLGTLAKVDTLSAELGGITAERDALASQNERLQHLLLKLKRRQFGRKSERLPEDQLLLAFEEIEATLAGNAAEAGKQSPSLREQQKKRRRAGRGRASSRCQAEQLHEVHDGVALVEFLRALGRHVRPAPAEPGRPPLAGRWETAVVARATEVGRQPLVR